MPKNLSGKLTEECGLFGFFDADAHDVSKMVYYGLYALQHRGQEACGIAVSDGENGIKAVKDLGLVNEVFNTANIAELKGNIGIGHVRYSADGGGIRENAMPFVTRDLNGALALAFNGNILNAKDLREELERKGAIFQSSNNAETIMHLAAHSRKRKKYIEDALLDIMTQLDGAYSMIFMTRNKLIGVRDPHGFRPLAIGKLNNSYIVCSETSALDVIHAQYVRDVAPGEIVVISNEGIKSLKHSARAKPSLCVFEYIYFARPDSVIDGVSVYNARVEAGKRLAERYNVPADIVIGVPDSGLNFAIGYAEASGVPYGEGFIKNRYTGRTFIKPTQSEREIAVGIKLNVLKENIRGKRVVMVDDSIVRGTTCAGIIKRLKAAGAAEVHMRVASPPFMWPCYFGTDIPSRKDLMAVNFTTEEIRERIGADSLGYLTIKDLDNIGLRKNFGYCNACFTGKYPVKLP